VLNRGVPKTGAKPLYATEKNNEIYHPVFFLRSFKELGFDILLYLYRVIFTPHHNTHLSYEMQILCDIFSPLEFLHHQLQTSITEKLRNFLKCIKNITM